jgi:hypothetical protein
MKPARLMEQQGLAAHLHVSSIGPDDDDLSMMNKAGVVLLPSSPLPPEHERQSHAVLGTLLAELLGTQFAGDYAGPKSLSSTRAELYFVPTDTLSGELPQTLGIRDQSDLFGGVVADPFMATKAITHPLVSPDAAAPESWSRDFTRHAANATLKGFTAFSEADALRAGQYLLDNIGPLRIKPVRAKAGRGQVLVRNTAALEQVLSAIDAEEMALWGLGLEEHLEQVTTYSVGQAMAAGTVVSYYGTQRLTKDNGGESVYGGSDLVVVRGGYEKLAELPLPNKVRMAIGQARIYEVAAHACYPSLIASRLNYDIAQGVNGRGEFRSGVLEQSWRIGGASGAEILALRAFASDNSLHTLHACTSENYGEDQTPPDEDATLLFRGDDAQVGFITKIAQIQQRNRLDA